jgi:hypothetical protein
MEDFKKGDILVGQKRAFNKAYHPIVYISGIKEAPLAVVLTHSTGFSCNMPLKNIYDGKENKVQYFVAHLIEKIADWGHYEKIGELKAEDLELIEDQIKDFSSMTWSEYEEYTKGKKCPDH